MQAGVLRGYSEREQKYKGNSKLILTWKEKNNENIHVDHKEK